MDIGLRDISGTFHVPKDWVLLERTLLLLYGCCAMLDPDLNPVSIIQPYLREFVLGNRDFTQIALEAVRDTFMSAVTLPDDLRKFLVRANRGELVFRVRGVTEGAHALYAVGRQLIYTAVGLSCAIEALEAQRLHDVALARGLAAGAIAAALLLLVSSFVSRPRPR
jgi:predicted unusual protein kinase regulating ubiquinone biosynthesis (AarF/ABC1/UbiB family)